MRARHGVDDAGPADVRLDLSPDQQSFMVNKDIGPERWTITLNLFSTDPKSVISVTGNIFRADGGSASFVTCLERVDSSGDLRLPTSTFRLSCSGASACPTTAAECARSAWTLIADDIRVPASFFLPPDGLGSVSAAAAESFLDALIARLGAGLARAARRAICAAQGLALVAPRSALRAERRRTAARRSPLDRLNHLVTKDVGSERWAISYSLQP